MHHEHPTLTGDVNAHSTLWHSYTDDHKGQLIADVISNLDHMPLNTNTPTRVPRATPQQTSSPDITTVSNTFYNRTSWTTQQTLSSDHLSRITTINIRHDYRLQQNRRTFTNYKTADWTQFTEGFRFRLDYQTTNIHTANIPNNSQILSSTQQTRYINREAQKLQGHNITQTTTQVQEAIKQSKNNNSHGPDKLDIRHLEHIDPLGLAFLAGMLKTALNANIIPHIWKVANIFPIPKHNKDIEKSTSCRPISLLSVIAKTLEKSLLPYITANIPNTRMQHGYKTQHSTVTALHIVNNTVAIVVSKVFDTINIHTLIRKLLQTNIPDTMIKFIANYIKGRKAYATYMKHTSSQRQFKTDVPQGGVLSPTLFSIYTADIPTKSTSSGHGLRR